MALKGTASKEFVTKQILQMFEGSFKYDKEIRIPCYEDGQEVQIKVTLTAAKDNVAPNGDTMLPGATANVAQTQAPPPFYVPPSSTDKATVEALIASFDFK